MGGFDIKNVVDQIIPFWSAIQLIMVPVGLILAAIGIKGVLKGNRHGVPNYGTDLATFMAGVLLISLRSFMDALSQSIFNQPAPGSLASPDLSQVAQGTPYSNAVLLVFVVVQLVGLFSVIKGILLFKDGFEYKDKMGAAWTHMIGGVVAMNLYTLLEAVAAMFGSNAQAVVSKIIGA